MKKEIYLDYSSTTPVDKKVIDKMMPYFRKNYGNPSSIHNLGHKSLLAIDKARNQVADFLNCKQDEIIFTGSATEANNIAILGFIEKIRKERKNIHVITSKIEHDAVLEPIKNLEKRREISATFISVGKKGIISLNEFKKSIKKETSLVSIMYANNEIGTIQPIKEIGEIIKEENKKRSDNNKIFFHTDSVQAINYLNCKVDYLGVDFLVFSGHKIYGPKGIGALYIKRKSPVASITYGGGQEKGLRSGTENVSAIVGLGEAVKMVSENENKRILALRDKIVEEVLKKIKGSKVNGCLENRLPNNINFSFKGAEGESIIMALDQKGIMTSTGSACSAKNLEPSHVLLATGISREEAHCSLRVSLGRYTKKEDIDYFLNVLPDIIKRLKKISGR